MRYILTSNQKGVCHGKIALTVVKNGQPIRSPMEDSRVVFKPQEMVVVTAIYEEPPHVFEHQLSVKTGWFPTPLIESHQSYSHYVHRVILPVSCLSSKTAIKRARNPSPTRKYATCVIIVPRKAIHISKNRWTVCHGGPIHMIPLLDRKVWATASEIKAIACMSTETRLSAPLMRSS